MATNRQLICFITELHVPTFDFGQVTAISVLSSIRTVLSLSAFFFLKKTNNVINKQNSNPTTVFAIYPLFELMSLDLSLLLSYFHLNKFTRMHLPQQNKLQSAFLFLVMHRSSFLRILPPVLRSVHLNTLLIDASWSKT